MSCSAFEYIASINNVWSERLRYPIKNLGRKNFSLFIFDEIRY